MKWSWRKVESARVGGDTFELCVGGTPAGRLEMYGRVPNPSLVLGPLVDALAGPAAVKPDTPLGQPADDRPLTERQRSLIHVLMAELGYRERPARLAAVGKVLGREVESTNTLTRDEASVVIERAQNALRGRRGGAA